MDGQSTLDVITFFIFLMLYAYISRELEIWRMASEIEAYISLFKRARDRALSLTLNSFKSIIERSGKGDIAHVKRRVNALVDVAIIEPVSRDPFGLIRKLKLILRTAEETMEHEVRELVPLATDVEVKNLLNLISATRYLNNIYKVVDHIYRIARKFKSLWLLMQLSAYLPFITEEVKAMESAVDAFNKGFPIGDSVGPLVAACFLERHKGLGLVQTPVPDTIVSRVFFKGREIFVVKAKGPGGNTGRIDDAVAWILERYGNDFKMIITVDAARKFEGEESGSISHGFGVAMGGTGVERFNIEELAAKYNLPLYAILIKMSESEALSVLTKNLYEAALKALDIVERVIVERSSEGDKVMLIGVGNTVGVPP